MTPGERITVITKIASALSGRNWSEVDLTLDQFGLPTSESWNGDQYSYVVEHVKRADDETLFGIHDHLFPGEAVSPRPAASREEDAGGIWEPGYFRLFISHSSQQAVEVGELKTELRELAICGFVAHDDIEPTEEWRDVIEVALHTCEALAVYLTADFHPSLWTDQEVGVALARAVLVIPIRKGATPYGFMGKYQALSGANKAAPRLAQDIAEILQRHSLTTSRYAAARQTLKAEQDAAIAQALAVEAEAAVRQFENAGSFDGARRAWHVLRGIQPEALTPSLLNRIEDAYLSNSQLGAQWNFGSTTVRDEAEQRVAALRAAGASPV